MDDALLLLFSFAGAGIGLLVLLAFTEGIWLRRDPRPMLEQIEEAREDAAEGLEEYEFL